MNVEVFDKALNVIDLLKSNVEELRTDCVSVEERCKILEQRLEEVLSEKKNLETKCSLAGDLLKKVEQEKAELLSILKDLRKELLNNPFHHVLCKVNATMSSYWGSLNQCEYSPKQNVVNDEVILISDDDDDGPCDSAVAGAQRYEKSLGSYDVHDRSSSVFGVGKCNGEKNFPSLTLCDDNSSPYSNCSILDRDYSTLSFEQEGTIEMDVVLAVDVEQESENDLMHNDVSNNTSSDQQCLLFANSENHDELGDRQDKNCQTFETDDIQILKSLDDDTRLPKKRLELQVSSTTEEDRNETVQHDDEGNSSVCTGPQTINEVINPVSPISESENTAIPHVPTSHVPAINGIPVISEQNIISTSPEVDSLPLLQTSLPRVDDTNENTSADKNLHHINSNRDPVGASFQITSVSSLSPLKKNVHPVEEKRSTNLIEFSFVSTTPENSSIADDEGISRSSDDSASDIPPTKSKQIDSLIVNASVTNDNSDNSDEASNDLNISSESSSSRIIINDCTFAAKDTDNAKEPQVFINEPQTKLEEFPSDVNFMAKEMSTSDDSSSTLDVLTSLGYPITNHFLTNGETPSPKKRKIDSQAVHVAKSQNQSTCPSKQSTISNQSKELKTYVLDGAKKSGNSDADSASSKDLHINNQATPEELLRQMFASPSSSECNYSDVDIICNDVKCDDTIEPNDISDEDVEVTEIGKPRNMSMYKTQIIPFSIPLIRASSRIHSKFVDQRATCEGNNFNEKESAQNISASEEQATPSPVQDPNPALKRPHVDESSASSHEVLQGSPSKQLKLSRKCLLCINGETFDSYCTFDKHVLQNHPNPFPYYLRCPHAKGNCQRHFTILKNLRKHIRDKHAKEDLSLPIEKLFPTERPHKCSLCGKIFSCEPFLSTHKFRSHAEKKKKKEYNIGPCSICKMEDGIIVKFKNYQGLDEHILSTHPSAQPYYFRCPFCVDRIRHFRGLKCLNNHIGNHHNDVVNLGR